jgi:hypothetical protein
MPTTGMRTWRSHPLLIAVAIGAIVGAANAILIETTGLLHRNSTGVLPLLFPSTHDTHFGQTNAMQTALLLLIEVAGNVLGFAFLFWAPVALVVGIRRALKGRQS